jgi:hypothetical protein
VCGHPSLTERDGAHLSDQLRDVSVTTGTEDTEAAESNTNLRSNLRLYGDIADADVDEPPSTHGVEFRIDQFTHFIHDFPPQEFHVNNIWLKASQCLTPAGYRRVVFPSVREITYALQWQQRGPNWIIGAWVWRTFVTLERDDFLRIVIPLYLFV